MKTREQIAQQWKRIQDSGDGFTNAAWGTTCAILDSRDLNRVLEFFSSTEAVSLLGVTLKDDVPPWEVETEWTLENVTKQLLGDAEFGEDKALNERGISSELMYYVCQMWLWVLEDEELLNPNQEGYGLSCFQAILAKYRNGGPS